MFTGLVEGRGTVRDLRPDGSSIQLVVEAPDEWAGERGPDCRIGDSIAINGCCLTVVAIDGRLWTFQAGAETLSKTNLGDLAAGAPVNLERALPADGRLGGHFVQGHVDGVGQVAAIDRDGQWVTMRFLIPARLARQMVSKGSVTVDGISLTVVEAGDDWFTVALIPHTLDVTTLGVRRVGDRVNIETDILGKYVERFLGRVTGDS